jgi:riboflavin synthase
VFTGLIEEIGTIISIESGATSAVLTIGAKTILEGVKLGDSIATNGVCLTVTSFSDSQFTVDVMPETMRMSNLGELTSGSRINIERAMKLGDRFGGHIVSGHIDGTGVRTSIEEEENATWVEISEIRGLMKYIINKGSITIDGTSLTVASLDDESFKVSIIPHTKDETTLLSKSIGSRVNLETDVIGKYIEKLMMPNLGIKSNEESNISMNFLAENGFV